MPLALSITPLLPHIPLPAAEFNMGAAPNLQLHVIIPGAYLYPSDAYGIGDIELGAKYRVVQEHGKRPQVGVFPLPSSRRLFPVGS